MKYLYFYQSDRGTFSPMLLFSLLQKKKKLFLARNLVLHFYNLKTKGDGFL